MGLAYKSQPHCLRLKFVHSYIAVYRLAASGSGNNTETLFRVWSLRSFYFKFIQ